MGNFPRHWRINAHAANLVPPPAKSRDWYRINNAASSTAEVVIYDEIGEWGITAKDFVNDLGKVTAKNIDVRLNSGGGSVFEGLAIFEALRRHPANITTYVDGIAASIASVIAMSGDRRVVSRNGSLMIHEASGVCAGPSVDMRQMGELLNRISDQIADVYTQRTGEGSVASWRGLMKAETWFTGSEAVDAGLATEVADDDAEDAWAPFAHWTKQEPADAIDWQRTVAHLWAEGVRVPERPAPLFPKTAR
ncbi:head maturation protease, ClpP-related [Streptomyces sp. NPDC026672]|uniref:head maturation protease, ClpP-related n=1 Tax=unclassified Streptomyces TaxID=2593676 RepID=UPI003405FE93